METVKAQFDAAREWINTIPDHLGKAHDWINETFGPTLQSVFAPTNNVFTYIPEEMRSFVATECAVLLFQLAIVWVLFLKPEYVNVDRPNNRIWNDLRLWTILSMLPHMYFYRIF